MIGPKGIKNGRFGDHRNYEELLGKERSINLKKEISKRYSGNGNPKAINWKLTSPEGKVFTIKGELEEFTKNNNLSFSLLRRNLGKIVVCNYPLKLKYPDTQGWKLEIIDG